MKNVFVTGASGFLGRYIVDALLARGCKVYALARSAKAESAVRALGAEAVTGDLSHATPLREALRQCDTVIHSAALFAMWAPYSDFEAANVEGTRHLLSEAAAAGITSFVQIGAAGVVMGEGRDLVGITENEQPLAYLKWAPYIASKAAAETLVLHANTPQMRTSVIRPPLIWGKNMPQLALMAENVKANRFRWPGRADRPISVSHAANVAQAAVLAAEHAPGGKAYFVTDGETHTLKELMTALLGTQGIKPGDASVPVGVARVAARVLEGIWSLFHLRGEPPLTRQMVRFIGYAFTLDDGLARRELGYRPVIDWKRGIAQMS